MRSLGPVGHFPYISEHLLTWLVRGSFQWRHGLLFTDCIVWDDKDKLIGIKRSHRIHLGRGSTGSPKLQLFQLSQHSYVTNCRMISSSAYFLLNMTLKFKMQPSEGYWEAIHKSSVSSFRDFFVKTTNQGKLATFGTTPYASPVRSDHTLDQLTPMIIICTRMCPDSK